MKVAVRSTLVSQLPQFIVDEDPLFLEFLAAYYEYLEQTGMSIDYVRNALTFLDVDTTIDQFINFFWEEVKGIPLDARVDRRLLAKHIYDLYQSKGTIRSYKLLFRILYGEDVDIYTPKSDMLRVSDGKWTTKSVMRVTSVSGDPFELVDLTLYQKNPTASLLVQNVIKMTTSSQDFYDIYVEPRTTVGSFRFNENAFADYVDSNGNTQTVTVYVTAIPAAPVIEDGGMYCTPGESIIVIESPGVGFASRVTEVRSGGIDSVMILDGGSGYSVGNQLTVDNTNTSGSGLVVRVAAVDAGVITKLNVVNNGQGYYSLPVITGAHGGQFLAKSSMVGSILSIDTTDPGYNHAIENMDAIPQVTNGIIISPIGTFQTGETLTVLSECIITENYFTLLNEDGTTIINEVQGESDTGATVASVVNNVIGLNGLTYRRSINLETEVGDILSEDGSVVIMEVSSADLNRRTIQGTVSGAKCRILDMKPALLSYDIGTITKISSRFDNQDGKVSESTKRIQDSKFYQIFSYVIKSSQSIGTYRNIVQKLLHPAGMAMFGEVNMETAIEIGLRVVQNIENIVNLDSFAELGFGVGLGQFQISWVGNASNYSRSTYENFDQWKFQNIASANDSNYMSNSEMYAFANITFDSIYNYDSSGKSTGYRYNHNNINRDSELRVNGTLV